MQSLWLIILVFFLVILIVPIFLKAYLCYDLINNLGVISLYVFFIKIIAYKVKFDGKKIVLFTSSNEKEIPLEISKGKMRFIEQFGLQLKEKMVLKRVDVYSNIGATQADKSALMFSAFDIILCVVFCLIKNVKGYCKLNHFGNVSWNKQRFIFSMVSRSFITIFDLIYCAFMALIIIKRSEKYERV